MVIMPELERGPWKSSVERSTYMTKRLWTPNHHTHMHPCPDQVSDTSTLLERLSTRFLSTDMGFVSGHYCDQEVM